MKYTSDAEAIFWILTAILTFILAIGAVVFGLKTFITESTCLSYGWKDAKIDWRLKGYCIREENEYEIVKPLNEIKGE